MPRLHNADAAWPLPAFPRFLCIPWLNAPPGLSCPEGLSRPFVFARRASAASNHPNQFHDFRVSRGYSPRGRIPMPVGKISDGHQKTLRWASEGTPMPIRRDSRPQRTKLQRKGRFHAKPPILPRLAWRRVRHPPSLTASGESPARRMSRRSFPASSVRPPSARTRAEWRLPFG